MPNESRQLEWEAVAERKYQDMVQRIPLFHREIARQVVEPKAIENAVGRGSSVVEEEDILRAFFSEVPMTFYSLMIRLFEQAGFDYQKYEPERPGRQD